MYLALCLGCGAGRCNRGEVLGPVTYDSDKGKGGRSLTNEASKHRQCSDIAVRSWWSAAVGNSIYEGDPATWDKCWEPCENQFWL